MGNVELLWNTTELCWSDIYFLWNEAWILKEVVQILNKRGGNRKKGAPLDKQTKQEITNRIGKENTKKLIKLLCVVNGETFEEEKEFSDVDVKVSDIYSIVTEVEKSVKIII